MLYTVLSIIFIRTAISKSAPRKDAFAGLVVEYEFKKYDFFPNSSYIGEPGPENEKAWHDLMDSMAIRVTAEELAVHNQQSVPLPDGGYLAWLGVFHELHCVKLLRHWSWRDHYPEFANLSAFEMAHNMVHIDHCLEILRSSALCPPNMETEHIAIPEPTPMSFPRFFYLQCCYKPREVQGVDLAGKTAIVTGANSGVGFETCRQLLDLGLSKLILAVRNEEKGKEAASKLLHGRDLAPDTLEVWLLDHSSYDSVVAFSERARTLERLDFVNLNAGTALGKRVFNDKTGHDEIVQVNYLSTALLAILLLQVVKDKPSSWPAKITFTSSDLPAFAKFQERTGSPLLKELDKPGELDLMDRMVVSKLLCQFFIVKLAEHVSPSVAVINAASPSGISDSVMLKDHNTFSGAMNRFMMRCIGRTSAAGARMMTDAIVQRGKETHGKFLAFQEVASFAPILYTEEGKDVSDRLWQETMDELSFAKPEDILRKGAE
ncbi:hypothetical protein VSDG_02060 [Cytospora chrysosperma]|uniref:Ketoreductase (KR) domain-containing protein n=1 Tax=Cytospora chrysosperma TaxID=252740 RepID=A0A423WDY6_CYTCH|nr:hypothetical protein VSDG_02060 [Valsa sordida]